MIYYRIYDINAYFDKIDNDFDTHNVGTLLFKLFEFSIHLCNRQGDDRSCHCDEGGSKSVGAVAEVGVAVARLGVAAVGAAVARVLGVEGARPGDCAAGCKVENIFQMVQ